MILASGSCIKILVIVSLCVIWTATSGDALCSQIKGCFPCHCKSGRCDSNGNCLRRQCKTGYFNAPGKANCQMVDMAFLKPTSYSSQANGWDAAQVVDGYGLIIRGRERPPFDEQCFKSNNTIGNREHWWQVDFLSKINVRWMKLTPQPWEGKNEMENFAVYVSNVAAVSGDTAWKKSAQLCYTHGKLEGYTMGNIHIACNQTLYGRYLIVSVENSDFITFCKLTVSQCPKNLYGQYCTEVDGVTSAECKKQSNGCYPCHCESGQCDDSSGNCVRNECKKGYLSASGKSNCQIVDIAYNKPTSYSSQLALWYAANVVDGKQFDSKVHSSSQCFHSETKRADHWWQVDFLSKKYVKWMKLIPRMDCCQARMTNFKVYVSNVRAVGTDTAWKESAQICHTHGEISTPVTDPIDIECGKALYGRYLIVFVENTDAINFCKLTVFQCAENLYGKECLKECSCPRATDVCNPITGVCESKGNEVSGAEGKKSCNSNPSFVAFSVATDGKRRGVHFRRDDFNIIRMQISYYDNNYYNHTTDSFTAPVDGVYAFFYGARLKDDHGYSMGLRIANRKVHELFTSGALRGGYNHVSGSVFYAMRKGERAEIYVDENVWVISKIYIPTNVYFNGYLMHENPSNQN